jgi:hypothetical protein
VNLTLTSVDNATHNFFVDWDGDESPNGDEPTSPDFQTETINYSFNATTLGTFTYYCQYHKGTMFGTFIVKTELTSDLNGDEIVNIVDLFIVARAFGCEPGDENWNATADMNQDNIVNIQDVYSIARDYGKTA